MIRWMGFCRFQRFCRQMGPQSRGGRPRLFLSFSIVAPRGCFGRSIHCHILDFGRFGRPFGYMFVPFAFLLGSNFVFRHPSPLTKHPTCVNGTCHKAHLQQDDIRLPSQRGSGNAALPHTRYKLYKSPTHHIALVN